MAGKNTSVYGIYRTHAQAEQGVDLLRQRGFRSSDVSALLQDNVGTREFAHKKDTKAPEGATAGATTGVVLGGTLGWLASAGSLAIPGVGPFIAAGPIVAMLAGAGAGGVTGGIIGALIGMGIPEYEAKRYEGHVKDGGILVSIHCDSSDWVKRAKEVLEQSGAIEIGSSGEASAASEQNRSDYPRASGY
jgi:hypothetical protein